MSRRPTKPIDLAAISAILAHGDKHGDKVAAAWGKVSLRSLQRYRARLRAGEMPQLAALVARQKSAALERVTDLLTETYEAALRRLQVVLPEATPHQVIGAVKICGELALTRRALLEDDDEQPGNSRAGAGAEEASREEDSARVH